MEMRPSLAAATSPPSSQTGSMRPQKPASRSGRLLIAAVTRSVGARAAGTAAQGSPPQRRAAALGGCRLRLGRGRRWARTQQKKTLLRGARGGSSNPAGGQPPPFPPFLLPALLTRQGRRTGDGQRAGAAKAAQPKQLVGGGDGGRLQRRRQASVNPQVGAPRGRGQPLRQRLHRLQRLGEHPPQAALRAAGAQAGIGWRAGQRRASTSVRQPAWRALCWPGGVRALAPLREPRRQTRGVRSSGHLRRVQHTCCTAGGRHLCRRCLECPVQQRRVLRADRKAAHRAAAAAAAAVLSQGRPAGGSAGGSHGEVGNARGTVEGDAKPEVGGASCRLCQAVDGARQLPRLPLPYARLPAAKDGAARRRDER